MYEYWCHRKWQARDAGSLYTHICSFLQFVADHDNCVYQLTPLALASAKGNLKIVEMLVGARANVNYDSEVSYYRIHFMYAVACHENTLNSNTLADDSSYCVCCGRKQCNCSGILP